MQQARHTLSALHFALNNAGGASAHHILSHSRQSLAVPTTLLPLAFPAIQASALPGLSSQQLRCMSDEAKERRLSSFQLQKLKAMGGDPSQQVPPEQAPIASDAIMVQPNEAKASLEQVAQVVGHSALVITRPIEWGTVILGYEQANRYTVYDETGAPVAQLAEDYTGLKNELGRQVLRTRRSFTATVFSADGSQVIFRLKRPMYLINSTMFVEDAEGNTVGEIRQRWHPIKRNYDLYRGKEQFAAISGNFLAWEFELKDNQGGTLALVDRNFQGFGKELFTDAGKYVIHFGMKPDQAASVATHTIEARAPPGSLPPPVTPLASARTDIQVIPTVTGNQLAVARSLQLDERMLVLAAAISIDYDFFSQHSHGSGWLTPPLIMPLPGSSPTVDPTAGSVPGAAPPGSPEGMAGAASAGAAGETASRGMASEGFQQDAAPPPPGTHDELHLGGDEFHTPGQSQGFPSEGEEFKWDLPDQGGAGTEEAAGSAGGILSTLWSFFSDD